METNPRWLRDLVRYLPLKTQFVLSGNVRDLQAYRLGDGNIAPLPLSVCLLNELKSYGYQDVLQFTPMGGFTIPGTFDPNQVSEAMARTGLGSDNPSGMGIEALTGLLSAFVSSTGEPAALIVDFASRLVNRSDVLTAAEHALFTRVQILSHSAKARPAGPARKAFYNTIIWITERDADLPDFLTVDNPKLRTIPISVPDSRTRKALAPILLRALPGHGDAAPSELAKHADAFVNLTDGLLLSDMHSIAQLGRSESLRIGDVADAVRRYKVGITEDPWRMIDRAKIASADAFIRGRVKGQDHAVVHMLDIIKRAVTGVGRSSTTGRPRGVAFLAGPTGTGKTELAKTITSLLFGDETAYIRFDMSEFSAEHADQRLIGAPPGYVG
ncbi:MAG: ATPase, partial [Planctomycetaceae bacterium]|nr:ATPase [Planctomycetaceae bacterium]